MEPENVAIHVAQNAVNFAASSIAWLAISMLTSRTTLGRDVGSGYHSPTSSSSSSYDSSATLRSEGVFDPDYAANELSNSSPNSRQNMGDSLSSEMAKKLEQERLYEIQVQEYRRRKKMEAMKMKKAAMMAASEADAVAVRRDFMPSFKTSEDGPMVEEGPEKMKQRTMDVEKYQKYMQMKKAAENQLRKRVGTEEMDAEKVVIKSKGAPAVRRIRKIKKPSSS